MKRLVLGFLIGCMLLVFAGCGGTPQGASSSSASTSATFATIDDAMGRTVTLDKKPERIVVTSASFLEPLHEVGGDVVGRPDSKTQMPDYAKDKASVGKVYQIDLEKVLACEPDLVIVNKGMNEKLVGPLEESGIKTIVVDMKSYDDVKNMVKIFSQVTGETSKGDELVKSMEQTIADNPAWQTLPAIQQGKLYYLPQDLFLLSPGIHYPEAVETMAKLVYPEAFK